jgi:hypothetical protein
MLTHSALEKKAVVSSADADPQVPATLTSAKPLVSVHPVISRVPSSLSLPWSPFLKSPSILCVHEFSNKNTPARLGLGPGQCPFPSSSREIDRHPTLGRSAFYSRLSPLTFDLLQLSFSSASASSSLSIISHPSIRPLVCAPLGLGASLQTPYYPRMPASSRIA